MVKPIRNQILEYLRDNEGSEKFLDIKTPFINLIENGGRMKFKNAVRSLRKDDLIRVGTSSNYAELTVKIAGVNKPLKDIIIRCRITPNGENYIKEEITPFNLTGAIGTIIGDGNFQSLSEVRDNTIRVNNAPKTKHSAPTMTTAQKWILAVTSAVVASIIYAIISWVWSNVK